MLPDVESVWRPGFAVDMAGSLASLCRGGGDPTQRTAPDGAVWRTWRTPLGPATVRLVQGSDGIAAQAWGPGAEWAVAGVPDVLGVCDDPAAFRPRHPVIRDGHARRPGLRTPRCRRVFEVLVPSILEQKVTGGEARRSWRQLLARFGEPAPGPPSGMRVCPPPAVWARIPSWEWHRAGVDGKRSRTIIEAARVAARLEAVVDLPLAAAAARLTAVPGVGPWTAAEVGQRALGDVDAVSVGDFHLPSLVGWALVGRPLDDAGMLEVLAPYAPQRYRAVRLVELSGVRRPRFGPRYSPQDMRAI